MSETIQILQCPHCGGPVQRADQQTCEYCGYGLRVKQKAASPSPSSSSHTSELRNPFAMVKPLLFLVMMLIVLNALVFSGAITGSQTAYIQSQMLKIDGLMGVVIMLLSFLSAINYAL